MNKQILSIFVLCAFSYSTQAQEVKGGISDSMMQQIKQSYANTPTDKAIRNAIGSNDIRKLALNQDNLKGMDTHFSIKVSSKGITDQKSSGRCWLFTGLNVMRAKAIAKHNLGSFEFSQTYPFFFDQLEKANLFLQGIIDTSSKPMDDKMVEWLFRNPLSDGGTFTGVADIVSKYGLVPKDVMPETNSSENTSRMAGLIALIYTGALQVDAGVLSKGEVVALINYMSQILVELVKLANLIITMTKAVACGNRIEAVLAMPAGLKEYSSEEPEEADSVNIDSEEKTGSVVFEHVGLRYYEGGEEALTDISFRAGRGDTIGIIGGTGSGKSSLVNLIPRFYDVTSGSVRVDGRDVRSYDTVTLRNKIGVVMQKAVLFQGTIRDNLKWGNEAATDEEIYEALRTAQAEEIVRQKKDGLDEMIEQEGRNLSGGQKQRLSIARALVRKPEILILDDSASALDYATDAALRKALKEMPGDTTVFIVSQRASSLMHADMIIVLDDGRAVGMGTHEELLKSCEVYQEIYYSQFEKKAGQGE